MTFYKTKDGTRIFYKDWGQGLPIVFLHGWPLSGDAWDAQMLYFGANGHRVIAHDRRGHGRSEQTWHGNDINRYADDLSELIETLDLKNIVLVGHSTGGGEAVRFIGRHGSTRLSRLVLVGAVPPLMLRTNDNPDGAPIEIFDTIRQSVATNRSQYFRDICDAFYGFNRIDADKSQGLCDSFWSQGMMGGIKAQHDCIHAFSAVDYSEDLAKVDIPTLFIHGDDDQMVPIDISARKAAELIPHALLKVYRGGGHGLAQTHVAEFNTDLTTFIGSATNMPSK